MRVVHLRHPRNCGGPFYTRPCLHCSVCGTKRIVYSNLSLSLALFPLPPRPSVGEQSSFLQKSSSLLQDTILFGANSATLLLMLKAIERCRVQTCLALIASDSSLPSRELHHICTFSAERRVAAISLWKDNPGGTSRMEYPLLSVCCELTRYLPKIRASPPQSDPLPRVMNGCSLSEPSSLKCVLLGQIPYATWPTN